MAETLTSASSSFASSSLTPTPLAPTSLASSSFESSSSTSSSSSSSSSVSSFPLSSSTFTTSPSPASTSSSATSSSINPTYGNSTTPGNSTITEKPSTHHGSTISGGAVAGIAIATFIIGALLGLVGFWLVTRRSKPSRRPRKSLSSNGYSRRDNFARNGVVASKDIEIPMQDHSIGERADDSQLRNQMQNLAELIYQHVENHYTTGPYTGNPNDLTAGLTKCGYSERTEPTAFTLGSLLANPNERRTAIKSLIAWVVLRGVELRSGSEYSLLPNEITGFYRTVSKRDERLNEQDAFGKSLSRWRQLSAHLLSPTHSQQDPLKNPSITKVVNLLNSILQPFIKPGSGNSQSQFENLASIIHEGKEFGMLLLRQPGTWVFGWEATVGAGARARDQIVVFPSLEEVINRGGKELRRIVSEQEREGM